MLDNKNKITLMINVNLVVCKSSLHKLVRNKLKLRIVIKYYGVGTNVNLIIRDSISTLWKEFSAKLSKRYLFSNEKCFRKDILSSILHRLLFI